MRPAVAAGVSSSLFPTSSSSSRNHSSGPSSSSSSSSSSSTLSSSSSSSSSSASPLLAELRRLQSLSAGPLLSKLPDGGERVTRRIAELQRAIEAAEVDEERERTRRATSEAQSQPTSGPAAHSASASASASASSSTLSTPTSAQSSGSVVSSGGGGAASSRPRVIQVGLADAAAALSSSLARAGKGKRPTGRHVDGASLSSSAPSRAAAAPSDEALAGLFDSLSLRDDVDLEAARPSNAGASSQPQPPHKGSEQKAALSAESHPLTHLAQQQQQRLSGGQAVSGVRSALFPHQLAGVRWMARRESGASVDGTSPRGGIVADEPGLGKTLMMLALVAQSKRQHQQAQHIQTQQQQPPHVDGGLLSSRCTLVVCPRAVLRQWQRECTTHLEAGLLSVEAVVGGSSRTALTGQAIAACDLVVTSYETVRSQHQQLLARQRQAAARSQSQQPSTASSSEPPDDSSVAPLFSVSYLRVVADEAHRLRNRKAQLTAAVCALSASHRWYVTATPLQNGIDDLYPAFLFLQYAPYSQYDTWRQYMHTKDGRGVERCGTLLRAIAIRRRKAQQPQQAVPHTQTQPAAQQHSRADGGAKDEPRSSGGVQMTPKEQQFYDVLWAGYQEEARRVSTHGASKSHSMLLTLLLRLRQCCDHFLLTQPGTQQQQRQQAGGEEDGSDYAGIEDESDSRRVAAVVERAASRVSVDLAELNALLNAAVRRPPTGLRRLWQSASADSVEAGADSEADEDEDEDESSSGRVVSSATVSLLRTLLSSCKVSYCVSAVSLIRSSRPDDKVVVFSQFTRMLDVLAVCLAASGLTFERFDGSMSSDKQQAALDRFDSSAPSDCVCLLISLHAGGVGLNLTRASHCLMVDAWYNPAVEQQAHDRVHRLSQRKPVHIQRCVVNGTVEQHMMAIQRDKDGLAQATLDRDSSGSGRGNKAANISLHALQQLFKVEAER